MKKLLFVLLVMFGLMACSQHAVTNTESADTIVTVAVDSLK